MEDAKQIISRKYRLETSKTELLRKKARLEELLPQRIYEHRQAKVIQTEYEGSLRWRIDKFTGKRAEKEEACFRAVRQAEAAIEAVKRDLASAQEKLSLYEEELALLPSREALFAQYPQMEYLRQQDAIFAVNSILPLLEETEKWLLQARDWAENRNADFKPLGTQYDKTEALNEAASRAKEICALLEQIGECGFSLEIHSYFRSPSGFIAGAARQFGQQDRINYALGAVRKTREQIRELLLQLSDE